MAQLERERETRAQTQAEYSEKLQGSIFLPLFQFKVHRTNELIVNNTPVFFPSMWTCSFNIYIYIYEIGYCYEDGL